MLVGRGIEQQDIVRLSACARIGSGGSLPVNGDPGVGKTALLDDAVERADGVRFLRATGLEAERTSRSPRCTSSCVPPCTDRRHPRASGDRALGSALALRTSGEGNPLALIELGETPELLDERALGLPPALSLKTVDTLAKMTCR